MEPDLVDMEPHIAAVVKILERKGFDRGQIGSALVGYGVRLMTEADGLNIAMATLQISLEMLGGKPN